jgi:PAS domain S-box-containing protein
MSTPTPAPNRLGDSHAVPERLQELYRYDLLDTPPEEAFDRITDLAAFLFDAPTALVSLIDADRQWFKACLGFDERETELGVSFCIYAVRSAETLVVEDAIQDARFADNRLVTGDPGIRFYAGAPLRSPNGHVLGTLCVLDTKPRTPSDAQVEKLEHLAALVVDEMELRRQGRAQHRQLHTIADNVSDGLFRTTLGEGITYANQALADMFGYASPEAIQEADPSLFYDDLATRTRLFMRSEAEGGFDGIEVTFQRRDGSTFTGLVSCTAVYDENGDVLHHDGAITDITDQKRAERSARKHAAQIQGLANSIPGVIFQSFARARTASVDTSPEWDYGLHFLSEQVQPLLGLDPDDPDVFDRFIDRIPAPWHDTFVDSARAAVQNAVPWTFEMPYEAPWGERLWIQGLATPVDAVNSPSGERVFNGVLLDVTDRKKAEADLRKSQERWRRLIENQRDAIHITVDGVIRYANPAGVDLLGANALEDLVGRPLQDFVVGEEARATLQERAERLRNGRSTGPFEHTIERLDGERRIVESYATPIEYEGEPAAQGIVRDITERKRTRRQLQQAQKMEVIGTLAGGVAHDFNNILHAVSAYLDLVQDEVTADSSLQPLLTNMATGLERAEGLVDKLLAFSRNEEAPAHEPVDVGSVVRESVELVAPSLPKQVEVRTEIDAGCATHGDPNALHQVATNIMTNAGQAMSGEARDGGHVLDVSVATLDVDDDLARQHLHLEPGPYVRLSISDTGPGMDDETRGRIFDPFFTTKDAGEGTGLGLSVVHGIVESHGGATVVYSEVGEGTTFNIYLPALADADAALPQQTRPDQPSAASSPGRPAGRVLVVDDDAQITELESIRLARLGLEVTTCHSAVEALRAVDTDRNVSLVLTDYAMPDMTGLMLARTLRERGFDRPIVLTSGFSAQVSDADLEAAGITTFLRKPVNGAALAQMLQRCFH